MKHNLLPYFIFSILLTFLTAGGVKAQTASLYLSPSSGSFTVGSVFTVSIFVDTGSNEINTVFAELKFPPDILQVTSPTQGTSFIENWLTPPTYSNSQGIISFKGGIPGGIKTSAGLISSITFRAVSSGTAKIDFLGESKILLNDGKGTDILTGKRGASFNILFPLPEGPEVFSPTHPNPDSWYSDSSPSFSWDKESLSVSDFSWSFDQNPSSRPDALSEGAQTQVSFEGVADGTWYFHLRQKKDGVWGKTSTLQVKIDTSPPREFAPRAETYTRFAGYQTMVYFETKDDFSGIDRYEVGLIDLNEPETPPAFFTEQVSPYKVPFKKAGKYNVIIKAVDRAGNIREAEARFRMMTPLISHIEGRGLEIKGILISWWLFWILLILLIAGAAAGPPRFLKLKKLKMKRFKFLVLILAFLFPLFNPVPSDGAQTGASLSIFPQSGTFTVGSTFEVYEP